MNIKEVLKKVIFEALEENNEISIEDIIIDVPKDKKFGDYSTNIAMQLCRKLHKSPIEIANNIKESINSNIINQIEVVNPGFINFFVDKAYLFDNINKINNLEDEYGKNTSGNNKRINVEYVSANPTGLLHIGHARGAAYGDALTRIMKFSGYDVTREYYINDAGNQMDNLSISIKERYKQLCGLDYELNENCYHGEEIIEIARKIYEKYNDSKLDADLSYFKQKGLDYCLANIKDDLSLLRVSFDVWTSEQKLRDEKLTEIALEKLDNMGYTYSDDGAKWLKTTLYGDEKDRVLIKKDNNYTYLVPDIAYHLNKLERGYDELVDVLGADHHGYIKRLKAAVTMLGQDAEKLDVEIVQMVRLIKNNEEYKMSKRTGKALTVRDLVEEIGADAVRYFFSSRSLDTQMDFNIDLALAESNDNPVYYVQYAHARICSILREAKERNLEISQTFETIDNPVAYNVLAKLYEFEDIVATSARKKEVHLITNYVYELASLFHSYYGKEKIITDDIKYTSERLALIKAVKITIKNALNLIGVEAKERM